MTTMIDSMLNEFREEATVTTRILERVPEGKLSWKPHAKSMSLGELAIHIATMPGALARITQQDEFDVSKGSFSPVSPGTIGEIHTALEQSVREVEECLKGMTEQTAQRNWRLMLGERELLIKPRLRVLRSIMLNHWYHHRGQLSVYLRLLNVPVPAIYGPSADENPFS
jgi:uncharacterized damage-inducible protein DinB